MSKEEAIKNELKKYKEAVEDVQNSSIPDVQIAALVLANLHLTSAIAIELDILRR